MEVVEVIRWIVGGVALAFGGFCSAGNWMILASQLFLGSNSSFIPVIGGLIAFIGVLVIPVPGRLPWLWVPLVADFGCAPILFITGIFWVIGKLK